MNNSWWKFENLPKTEPNWDLADRGDNPIDQTDFHVDLGCGRVKKARLGIDKNYTYEVTDLCINLETLLPSGADYYRDTNFPISKTHSFYKDQGFFGFDYQNPALPFPNNSIESYISHHALEHIQNIERLMEEVYRTLKPGGIFRIIVPMFPSYSAVEEYDHKRYFCIGTFNGFCASDDVAMTDGFAERYNKCQFSMVEETWTENPGATPFMPGDVKELRVALRK